MKSVFISVIWASLAASLWESLVAVIGSRSFYPISFAIYFGIEFVVFLVVIGIAAFTILKLGFLAAWIRQAIFFIIVIAPSIISYFIFLNGVSYYQENGSLLVKDHQVTSAGVQTFMVDVGLSMIMALIVTFIYFRRNVKTN